jgi:hypothetical protein
MNFNPIENPLDELCVNCFISGILATMCYFRPSFLAAFCVSVAIILTYRAYSKTRQEMTDEV